MNISSVSDSEILEEYVRRFNIPAGETIKSSREASDHFRCYFANGAKREMFVVCFLNSQHQLLSTSVLFEGSLSTSAVYPREVITRVLELGAGAVVLGHNHPSGNATPSSSDRAVTKKLQAALGSIDVEVLDHIIVAKDQFYSFADHKLI